MVNNKPIRKTDKDFKTHQEHLAYLEGVIYGLSYAEYVRYGVVKNET